MKQNVIKQNYAIEYKKVAKIATTTHPTYTHMCKHFRRKCEVFVKASSTYLFTFICLLTKRKNVGGTSAAPKLLYPGQVYHISNSRKMLKKYLSNRSVCMTAI